MTLKIEVVEGMRRMLGAVTWAWGGGGAGFVGFPQQFVQSQSINYQSEVVFQIHFRQRAKVFKFSLSGVAVSRISITVGFAVRLCVPSSFNVLLHFANFFSLLIKARASDRIFINPVLHLHYDDEP